MASAKKQEGGLGTGELKKTTQQVYPHGGIRDRARGLLGGAHIPPKKKQVVDGLAWLGTEKGEVRGQPWRGEEGDTDISSTATSRRVPSMRSSAGSSMRLSTAPGASNHKVVGPQCNMEQTAVIGTRSTSVSAVRRKWSARCFPAWCRAGSGARCHPIWPRAGGSRPLPCCLGAGRGVDCARTSAGEGTKLRPGHRYGVGGTSRCRCKLSPKSGATAMDTDGTERFGSGIKMSPGSSWATTQGLAPCMSAPSSGSARGSLFFTNDPTRQQGDTTIWGSAQYQRGARMHDGRAAVEDSATPASRPVSLERVRNMITASRNAFFRGPLDPAVGRPSSLSSSSSAALSKSLSQRASTGANYGAPSPFAATRGPTATSNAMATAVVSNAAMRSSPAPLTPVPAVAAATHSSEPVLVDSATGCSALEKVHDVLTTSLLPLDMEMGGDSLPGSPRSARGPVKVKSEKVEAPPSLWVTRFVDKSTKYGLGFLLSNESVGVRFNDGTVIVLEPAGICFDYIPRSRRKRASPRAKVHGVRASGGGDEKHPTHVRHMLRDFPPCLQKKVHLLNRFRKHLQEFDDMDDDADIFEASRAASRAKAKVATMGEKAVSCEGETKSAQENAAEPCLTFVERWRCTRKGCLLVLSDGTIQVVFSDETEILLAEGAQKVTFVTKNGTRKTFTLERVIEEKRMSIIKRIRRSNGIISSLLLRPGRR